jgi:hypothetical protein
VDKNRLLELCQENPNYYRLYLIRHLNVLKDDIYKEVEELKRKKKNTD